MGWLTEAFQHIPEAATSPLALIAYLAALLVAAVLSMQIQRNRARQRLIQRLPRGERNARVREIIGKPIPQRFTGEQWLRHQRNVLLLAALALLAATAIIIFAIAAVTAHTPKPDPEPDGMATSSSSPVPAASPSAAPTAPSPVETDAALLSSFGLKLDKNYVHSLLGAPQFSDAAQNWRSVPIEIFSKNGYTLTVGYDSSNKVNIYSIVAVDPEFLKTEIASELPFTRTYAELKPDAFIAKDMSSKFYYYAEGHVGSTTSDGFVTVAYFYTDSGLEPGDQSGVSPPSLESDNLSMGDAPAESENAKAWRGLSRPNGYLRASEGAEVNGIFFHNMEWKDLTQS
ncbi:MAG TPA: ETEC_3214 domain-containing protein [Afipia sp.]